jgi:hypothetical protein
MDRSRVVNQQMVSSQVLNRGAGNKQAANKQAGSKRLDSNRASNRRPVSKRTANSQVANNPVGPGRSRARVQLHLTVLVNLARWPARGAGPSQRRAAATDKARQVQALAEATRWKRRGLPARGAILTGVVC